MKTLGIISILLSAAMLISSCDITETKKKYLPETDYSNFTQCHENGKWDSLRVVKGLVGVWEWESYWCYWQHIRWHVDSQSVVVIEFKADHTLEVKKNGVIIETATWKVYNVTMPWDFRVLTTPQIPLTLGMIHFCGNKLDFNLSHIDGCDRRFVRKPGYTGLRNR
jgi:hypothetical protein